MVQVLHIRYCPLPRYPIPYSLYPITHYTLYPLPVARCPFPFPLPLLPWPTYYFAYGLTPPPNPASRNPVPNPIFNFIAFVADVRNGSVTVYGIPYTVSGCI